MAKALFGYVGGADMRLVDEVRRLRRRVSDLETEVGRLHVERDLLLGAVREHHQPVDDMMTVPADLAELDDVGAPAYR